MLIVKPLSWLSAYVQINCMQKGGGGGVEAQASACPFLCSSIRTSTFLSHLFPLPCGAGSTVPCDGFDSSVIMAFSWCVVAVTLLI